ncbi:MAG: hypothetical protein D8H96_06645, partial [Lautropia sp.]
MQNPRKTGTFIPARLTFPHAHQHAAPSPRISASAHRASACQLPHSASGCSPPRTAFHPDPTMPRFAANLSFLYTDLPFPER